MICIRDTSVRLQPDRGLERARGCATCPGNGEALDEEDEEEQGQGDGGQRTMAETIRAVARLGVADCIR